MKRNRTAENRQPMGGYPVVEPDRYSAEFEEHRTLLFGIAYRMLGSVADAEDIVQEAWLRWQNADRSDIRSPKAFLITVVTRLAINQLDSARHQREEYIGPWLAEPLVWAPEADRSAQLAESLSLAFLRLLERLTPVERAVFLLREAFEYEYSEIAAIVEKDESNCRQILRRARESLAGSKPRRKPDPAEQQRLADEFGRAVSEGDLSSLVGLLSEDIALYTDGGGRVSAAINPIYGADRVSRFLLGVSSKIGPASTEPAIVNGDLGALIFVDGTLDSAMSFQFAEGKISGLYFIRNPEKLRHLRRTQ